MYITSKWLMWLAILITFFPGFLYSVLVLWRPSGSSFKRFAKERKEKKNKHQIALNLLPGQYYRADIISWNVSTAERLLEPQRTLMYIIASLLVSKCTANVPPMILLTWNGCLDEWSLIIMTNAEAVLDILSGRNPDSPNLYVVCIWDCLMQDLCSSWDSVHR